MKNKFRVWDERIKAYWHTRQGVTKYGIMLTSEGKVEMVCDVNSYREPEKTINYFNLTSLVTEEFINLLDKNGKEIYQGDIIKFDLVKVPHGPEAERGLIGEVWYDPEYASWTFGRWKDGDSWYGYILPGDYQMDSSTFEVIGNKWENPELLN